MTDRPTPPSKILVSVSEFAWQIGVGVSTAKAIVRAGDVETVKIGRLTKIPISSVERYIESLRTSGASKAPSATKGRSE